MKATCPGCDVGRWGHPGQWWSLSGYHGITGYFCPECYNKVSHDANGNPTDPVGYTYMLVKLGIEK